MINKSKKRGVFVIFYILVSIILILVSSKTYAYRIPDFTKNSIPQIEVNFSQEVTITSSVLYPEGSKYNFITLEDNPVEEEFQKAFVFQPFNNLPNGKYVLSLEFVNVMGNPGSGEVLFKVNVSCFSIEIIKPDLGVADHKPFNLTIKTNETSLCKLSTSDTLSFNNMDSFDKSGNYNHSLFNMSERLGYPVNESYYILCKHTETQQMCAEYFYIGYDTDPPRLINITAVPNPVVDSTHRYVNLSVETDDPTICTYKESCEGKSKRDVFPVYDPDIFDSFKENHSIIINYSDNSGYKVETTDFNEHVFNYKIECLNLANFSSSNIYNVVVDLEPTSDIIMESPGRCVNKNNFVFNVSTFLNPVEDCEYKGPSGTKELFLGNSFDGEKHFFWDNVDGVSDGENKYTVYCDFSQGGKQKQDFTIIVDREIPKFNLSADEYSCSLKELNIKLDSPDEICGIDYYNYTVTGENVSVEGKTSGDDVEIDDLDLINGDLYTVIVYAFDKAGNIAGPKPITIIASNSSILKCDKTPPRSTVYTENIDNSENKGLYIICEDKESGCADSFYYNFIPYTEQCNFNENTFSNEYYSYLPLTISYTLKACYIVYDNAGNNNTGSLSIDIKGSNRTIPQENKTCDDGKLNYHDNVWETDIDCGGPCDPCEPGQYCEENSDCITGNCSYGFCYGGEDIDNDGIPDWWEEKYGLDKNDAANSNKDTDGDGLTDLEEYQQGSDPTDPYNGGEEPEGSEYYTENERGVFPLILLIFGLLFMLGGIGYLLYSRYYLIPESKLKKQTITSGELGYRKNPSENISEEDIRKRKEQEKLKEEQYKKSREKKSKSRSSLLDIFKTNKTDKKAEESKKEEEPEKIEEEEIEPPEDKGKKKKRGKKEKEGDFVDLSELGKESGKEFINIDELKKKEKGNDKDIFEQLDKLSLSSKSKKHLKDSLKEDKVEKPEISKILSGFSKADFNKDVFQDLLTELLKTKKLSYNDVSEIVFDLLDEGKIDQKLANRIFMKLNLV